MGQPPSSPPGRPASAPPGPPPSSPPIGRPPSSPPSRPASAPPAGPAFDSGPATAIGQSEDTEGLPKGTLLEGKFEIGNLIDRGGMSSVYLGRDITLNRPVAIKFLAERFSADRELVTRFTREAQTTANLDHPNVIPIYAVGEQSGRYFFVMKYIKGRTLSQMIRERGALPIEETVDLITQILDGLEFVHSKDFVHRDIKSNNILVDERGHATILDFGILRDIGGSDLTKTGLMAGTPEYMSPEQAKDAKMADHRSDLYSLGVVLYEMLCGQVPFSAPTGVELAIKHLNEPPTPVTIKNPNISEPLAAVVMKCLEKNCDDRFSTAGEFKRALLAAAQGAVVPVVSGRPVKTGATVFEKGLKRGRRGLAALIIAVVVIGGAAWGYNFYRLRYGEQTREGPTTSTATRGASTRGAGETTGPGKATSTASVATSPATAAGLPSTAAPGQAAELAGLKVTSTPSRAKVYLDKKLVGVTPFASSELPAGIHRVAVKKKGYKAWRTRVALISGQSESVHGALKKATSKQKAKPKAKPKAAATTAEPSRLKVITKYQGRSFWANAVLDGGGVVQTPHIYQNLKPGRHTLKITRGGYKPVTKTVHLTAGKLTKVVVEMEK